MKSCLLLVLYCLINAGTWAEAPDISANAKTLTLAITEYPPYIDASQADEGYLVDIIRTALGRVGYDLQLVYQDWTKSLNKSQAGEVDGIMGLWFREERTAWFAYSDPIGVNKVILYKRKDFAFIFSGYDNLKPYDIAGVKGYAYPPQFITAGINLIEQKNDLMVLKSLLSGAVQFSLMDGAVMTHLLKKEFPQHRDHIEEVGPVVEGEALYIGFSLIIPGVGKKLADFNSGLKQLHADGTFNRIMEKHGVHH